MSDEQTMRDHIEDLLIERMSLYAQIEALKAELAAVRKTNGETPDH